MEAKKMKLTEFFNGDKIFTIPVYQRKYDWQQEHCRQFFSDIEKVIHSGREHFLGTFVYQVKTAADGSSEYIIIDGQQRITSIILFARVLYEFTNDDILKEAILSRFVKNLQQIGRKYFPASLTKRKYSATCQKKFCGVEFRQHSFKHNRQLEKC